MLGIFFSFRRLFYIIHLVPVEVVFSGRDAKKGMMEREREKKGENYFPIWRIMGSSSAFLTTREEQRS